MSILLSLDNGFGNLKLYFKYNGMEYKRIFESRVKATTKKTEDTLLINDELYDFSDAPLITDMEHCTKDNPLHRTLRDRALYEVYKITGETKYDLVTNCSLDSYKSDRGESIKSMHEEQKEINIENYFGEKVQISVDRILCQAENLSGLAICNDINLKDDDIICIDIGTKNFQLLSIVGAKLQKTYSSTLGMDEIYRRAYDLAKTVNNKIKSPAHIKDYLKRTYEGKFEPLNDVDEAIYNALEKEIFPEIERELNSMESMFSKIVFIGGGANFLNRFLIRRFKEERGSNIVFTKDSLHANAIGMYAKAERLLGYNDDKKAKEISKPKKTKTKKTGK